MYQPHVEVPWEPRCSFIPHNFLATCCTARTLAMYCVWVARQLAHGRLRESSVNCPICHCIILQEALCEKSVKQDEVMKTFLMVISMIRGGNRALVHRQFKQFLEELESEYGDLFLYNQNIMAEFNTRFQDFEGMKSSILLFNNPLGVVLQEQPANLQPKLCDLQADAFLQTKTEKGPLFFKLISSHRFPHFCDFG
ncbi:hypothetical protein PR048_015294 [Dryococelus australis]|uniref:Uncharacterized protein n=1 Tax=Dryococelus australis TaxID=614101 RepID=A0ABQ9HGJ7_9NEOP|nr:hypothetical protein PR048_015294 [Dryococelus australis]